MLQFIIAIILDYLYKKVTPIDNVPHAKNVIVANEKQFFLFFKLLPRNIQGNLSFEVDECDNNTNVGKSISNENNLIS